jgi:hypothetical protein
MEISLKRRSVPDRLAYLAAKLRESDDNREAVAFALDMLADELNQGGQ